MTTRSWAVLVLWAVSACGPTGQGGDGECESGAQQCDGNQLERCEDGSWVAHDQCTGVCDPELGCLLCAPNSTYCDGDTVSACDADGNGRSPIETCSGGLHCFEGDCIDLCEKAARDKSYLGCEYYSVDLDNAVEVFDSDGGECGEPTIARTDVPVCWNATPGLSAGLCDPDDGCPAGYACTVPMQPVCLLDAAHSPFAVVVSNPHQFPVRVTIANAAGTSQNLTVPAGQVGALFPQQMGFPDQSVDRTMQGPLAYQITSDAPIVAYQFNPLDNVDVFSNDGSLLIPRATWDVEYYAMTWQSLDRRHPENPLAPPVHDFNGYLTIVAGSDGAMVEVTPRANIWGFGAIPPISANTSRTFSLGPLEVVHLEARAPDDLTGSHVRSVDGRPFGLFAGHEAVNIPQSPPPDPTMQRGPGYADHLEEMMFPTSTWGKSFAIARSEQRNGEADRLRVMAQKSGTQVTFTPAPGGGNCSSLAAGQFCDVKIRTDTVVTTTQPVLIAHYLESVIWNNGALGPFYREAGNGDPSMSLAVPTEQFRFEYTVLVPEEYQENHIAIAAPSSGSVFLDGAEVTGQLTPLAGMHKAGRLRVSPGAHRIECPQGCGIEVMGYSDAVSYLFAGGLDLRPIVVE